LLLLIQFFLMRWGLSPLQRMARDLKLIESGSKNQLLGDYPRELRGVTNNLNLLIETERKQQARYRTTLADLAHSLKTPLAVITGVLQGISANPRSASDRKIDTQLDSVGEQLERMNQIVTYQLQRAVQSGSASSLVRQVSVVATVNKVLKALRKVYAEKSIHFTSELDPKVYFQGDERDLMEVIGNVMDNAFKYSVQRVAVVVAHRKAEKSGVEITVEDDGPGIPQDQQEFVLQRGARAYTLVQGHGIGLAVVTDIVNSYGGEILLEVSELGGARLVIAFQAPAP
ncbi:MAG TPA: GHKL domain-containing protein, partial [Porticoccaceae bacterium]|nr:GHKL domain-containing protein [Porticoccaceae bacterium]